MFEMSIKVSNSEKSMTKKHAVYEENIVMSCDDPTIRAYIKEAMEEFGDDVEDVQVRTLMIV